MLREALARLREGLIVLREPVNCLRELLYPLRQEFYGLREEVAGLRERLLALLTQFHVVLYQFGLANLSLSINIVALLRRRHDERCGLIHTSIVRGERSEPAFAGNIDRVLKLIHRDIAELVLWQPTRRSIASNPQGRNSFPPTIFFNIEV